MKTRSQTRPHTEQAIKNESILKQSKNGWKAGVKTRRSRVKFRINDENQEPKTAVLFHKKVKNESRNEKSYAKVVKEGCEIQEGRETWNIPIYVVEVSKCEETKKEVIEAKKTELQNLQNLGVIQKVKDRGQMRITSRWVNNMKEAHDGLKTAYKSRLVCRGFQDLDNEGLKVQSDSPTAQKEAMKTFATIATHMEIEQLSSCDIQAAFLQVEDLKRDIYVVPPKDVAEPGILWKLLKPLYVLSDAGRQFWLKVRKMLANNGYERVVGKIQNGKLVGLLLLLKPD